MERLTNSKENRNGQEPFSYWLKNNHPLDQLRAFEKLAEYEDAEEQGLLLRLPCPLGTKIYCIHNGFVEEGMFFEMSCFKFKDYYKKSWFLTREEAEQALKQMGE